MWQDNMNKTVDQTMQVLNNKKQELEVLDSALSGDAKASIDNVAT